MRERVELSGGPRVGSQLVSRDARCTKLGHARRSRVGVHSVAVSRGRVCTWPPARPPKRLCAAVWGLRAERARRCGVCLWRATLVM